MKCYDVVPVLLSVMGWGDSTDLNLLVDYRDLVESLTIARIIWLHI